METKYLKLEGYIKTGEISEDDLGKIREAAEIMSGGGLVAFPTETVYGLGCDARLADAAARIYAAKGRPSDNPLIVHISCIDELDRIVSSVPETAIRLAERFWPGPMTMVMNKSELIPDTTTGGLSTVAVRMPSHIVAGKLIELSGGPVAAPSANRSGRPSTTTASHCIDDLSGRVDMILDGGPCDIGVESTIIDLTEDVPVLLRPGAVTAEMLRSVLGGWPLFDRSLSEPPDDGRAPKAPGMKYRHYAPKAPLTVIRPKDPAAGLGAVYDRIAELARERTKEGFMTEVICTEECAQRIPPAAEGRMRVRVIGKEGGGEDIARALFSVLRAADDDDADIIIAEGFGEEELFLAIMNRLKKAAGWKVEEV